jgi:hypothetical protein
LAIDPEEQCFWAEKGINFNHDGREVEMSRGEIFLYPAKSK